MRGRAYMGLHLSCQSPDHKMLWSVGPGWYAYVGGFLSMTKNVAKMTKIVIRWISKGLAWPITHDLGGVKMSKKRTPQALKQEIERLKLEIELEELRRKKEKVKK